MLEDSKELTTAEEEFIARWDEEGFDFHHAESWAQARFAPEEAGIWRDQLGVFPRDEDQTETAFVARAFDDSGYAPEDAAAWLLIGASVEDAMRARDILGLATAQEFIRAAGGAAALVS